MAENFLKNLMMVEVYFENENQKVLLSKDKNNDSLFLVNAILNKKMVEGMTHEVISNTLESIEKIEETEEAICIITRYYNYLNIKDYLSNNRVSLSRQIEYGCTVLNRLKELKGLPTYAIASLFNHNNILVDDNGSIRFLDIIIVDNNYIDMSLNDVFKELANILHILFSGAGAIIEGEISETIPPDIERIIQKCLKGEYIRYEEIINDFKASKLYQLINPEIVEGKRVHSMRRGLAKRRFGFKLKKRGILVGIIVILLLPLIILGLDKINDKNKIDQTVSLDDQTNIEDDIISNEEVDENTSEPLEENENISGDSIFVSNDESLEVFFNEELLESIDANYYGSKDTTDYYDGTYSIKVDGASEDRLDYWIGQIDFNNDIYSFLRNRNVDFSIRIKSEKSTRGNITFNLYKGDKLLERVSKNIDLVEGVWSLHSLNINTGNGDYINVFFTPYNKGDKIWLDAFSAEILK